MERTTEKSKPATPAMIAWFIAGIVAVALFGCGQESTPPITSPGPATAVPTAMPKSSDLADVLKVSVSGGQGAYSLSVKVESPDTGCGSYADWWEVVTERGELLDRRVLLHSHVDEQPFTRSGGPIDIQPSETVIVRAHKSTTGYGGTAMRGTIADGFVSRGLSTQFGIGLESQGPLPTDCAV